LLLTIWLWILCYAVSAQVRIVSLSPMDSKALILLDAADDVVACTKWCPFAEEKTVVANAIDVNVEQVLRTKPDVVFASTLTNSESINTMQQLGLNVVILPRINSFEQLCANFVLIGKLIGKEALAQAEVAKAKQRLDSLKQRMPANEKPPKVMFQVGTKPVFVAIKNTFIHDYIVQAGGQNIYDDLAHGTVTRESVITRNPDAIFISTMPASAENAQAVWLSYNELSATQHNEVVLIDQEKASSPTVHTFVDVVEQMIKTLY